MTLRLPAILLLVLCTGCGVFRPGLPGSGIAQSEMRSVAEFNEVALAGFGRVEVCAGEAPSVRVTTDDNLVQHVETTVVDGVLQIKSRRPINPRTGLRVEVTTPTLAGARVSGAGDMHLRGVASEQLDVAISGAGSVTADGHVQRLNATISGVGDAELEALYADEARVKISGAGEANVYAANSIDAEISGVGDVVCHGNPTAVSQRISGVGELTIERPEEIEEQEQIPASVQPVRYTLGDR